MFFKESFKKEIHMALDTYRKAIFEQGSLLKALYPLKKDAAGGVCYALVIEYYRKLLKSQAEVSPADMVSHLKKNLGNCITRQDMQADGVKELQRLGASYDFVQLFNSMGRVSGVQFKFNGGTGITSGDFTNSYANETGTDFMLRVEFIEGSGHAIAIRKMAEVQLFDPNFGIFQDANASTLATELWNEYASISPKMVVSKYFIIEKIAAGGVGLGNVARA